MILGNRIFRNRVDAGRQLARRLSRLRGQDIVVLGLPRGGVLVACQVVLETVLPTPAAGVVWQASRKTVPDGPSSATDDRIASATR